MVAGTTRQLFTSYRIWIRSHIAGERSRLQSRSCTTLPFPFADCSYVRLAVAEKSCVRVSRADGASKSAGHYTPNAFAVAGGHRHCRTCGHCTRSCSTCTHTGRSQTVHRGP
eukprot:2181920-Pleurochrysis_carterae.AAC.1